MPANTYAALCIKFVEGVKIMRQKYQLWRKHSFFSKNFNY